jgi:hypothetical protein
MDLPDNYSFCCQLQKNDVLYVLAEDKKSCELVGEVINPEAGLNQN